MISGLLMKEEEAVNINCVNIFYVAHQTSLSEK